MGIDKDRLYVSVYTDDARAYEVWTTICGVDRMERCIECQPPVLREQQ